MTHEEQFINGVLCWRSSALDNWTPYTPEQLSVMLISARQNASAQRQAAVHLSADDLYEMTHRRRG